MKETKLSLLSEASRLSIVDEKYFHEYINRSTVVSVSLCKDSSILNNLSYENNLKASIYMFVSYLLVSIVFLFGKIIGYYYPLVENAGTNLVRGVILISISHFYFYRDKFDLLEDLSKPKRKLFFLFNRCFFGALCHFLVFEAFKYARISTAYTIFNISPIFTVILTITFLKEKIGIIDISTFLVCFLSVCLITKPTFLFGTNMDNGDTFFGLFLSIISAISAGISLFLNRVISKDFHYYSTIYLMGVFFILQSLLILPFTEYGLSTFNLSVLIIAILISIIFFFFLRLFVLSLNMGNPIKILPITYISIVLGMLYNIFIFQQPFDIWDIIGSFLIIFVNIIKIISDKK